MGSFCGGGTQSQRVDTGSRVPRRSELKRKAKTKKVPNSGDFEQVPESSVSTTTPPLASSSPPHAAADLPPGTLEESDEEEDDKSHRSGSRRAISGTSATSDSYCNCSDSDCDCESASESRSVGSDLITDLEHSKAKATLHKKDEGSELSLFSPPGEELFSWKRDYRTQRGDLKKGQLAAISRSEALKAKEKAAADEADASLVIAKSRRGTLTITLTPVEGNPGDEEESPMKKKKGGKKRDASGEVSRQYVASSTIPRPSWLKQDSFYLKMSEFVSHLNSKTKKAVWEKCFHKKGRAGVSPTLISVLKRKDQFLKLVTACTMIYVKSKLKQQVREKEARPHLEGCAQFIFDIHRQLHMQSFVKDKVYWSNMLKEYHAYIQDLLTSGATD